MKMNKLLGLCLVLFLVLAPSVLGWGILPAKQLGDFTTDTQTFDISVRNTDFDEGYFQIEFTGDLAEYASYTQGIFYIGADQGQHTASFTLTLPSELEPGKRTLKVIVRQMPSQEAANTIESLLTLVGEVVVNAPQQGNFVATQLFIEQSKTTENTPITISMLNKGDDQVIVYADVFIKGPTNELIDQWTTDKQVLGYLASGKIETFWQGEKKPGIYIAEIQFHYGDKTQTLRKEFLIGAKEVISLDVTSDRFILGEIVPLSITAYNSWNSLLAGVFAEIYVLTKEGQLVQTFKTISEDIPGSTTRALTAYWDTKNLLVGEYDLNVVMNFPEGQTQKQYPAVVSLDKLEVSNSLTGQVTGGDEVRERGQYSVFIILLIVLIITNVTIILYFKRMKGGSKKK